MGATSEDIMKRILCLPGLALSLNEELRGAPHPPGGQVARQHQMPWLHCSLLGLVMLTLNKLVVLLKKVLPLVNTNEVAACGVTPKEYKAAFHEKDTILTADIQETVMGAHPQREEVEAYLSPRK